MGGSISKQQRQQIATYRARFIFGETNLNLMNDQDLHENEIKCRNVTENYNLDKKKILQEILQKVESEPENIIDNNGILLCNSEKIIEILKSHLVKSPKYIEEELLKSINVEETSNEQLNKTQEVRPLEVRPQEVRPQEVRPLEVRPQEVRPQEVRPQEVRPQSNPTKSLNKAFGGSINRNSKKKKSVKLYY